MIAEVNGLPKREFPIKIDIKGTPVIVSPYQLGINYAGDYPSYHLGYYMRANKKITREFRLKNTGP